MIKKKQAGARLRAERRARGLSQQKLADMAGLTRMTVVRLEKGDQESANLGTLRSLATALGVRLLDLTDIEESPVEPAIAQYLEHPYGQGDRPTADELEWLRSLPGLMWDDIPPDAGSIHDLVQWRRKFSTRR